MSDLKQGSDANGPAHSGSEPFHLPIEGFQGTPEQIEQQWFEKVYKGRGDSMRQLTWRAVIMGSLLGGVLSLTNLYIGLKSGWAFPVAITACILSYALWTTFLKIGLARTPMTILENNCMQSTASSAGYSTGGTLISAFAAYLILNLEPLPLGLTMAWVFFLTVLGVTMAIPMKRQMINVEQLRFPSGIAAAETLQALHAHGNSGLRAARALGVAGVIAAADRFWAEGINVLSKYWEKFAGLVKYSSASLVEAVQAKVFGSMFPLMQGRTTVFSWDVLYVAAGAITGFRACATMLISGTLCWGVFVPWLQSTGRNSEFGITSSFKKDETQNKFLTSLTSPTNASPVGQYLWSQFPEQTRQALLNSALKPEEAKRLMVPALNQILRRPGFFEASRFAGVELSEETKVLLGAAPGSVPPSRLNRMLLQDSFPGTFAPSTGFPGLVQWTLWGGTSCMVTSGVLAFLLQWKSVTRAVKSLGSIFSRRKVTEDPLEAIETPMSWFAIGQGISLIALAILAHESFHMPYWQSVVAVVLSFLLALVACRITGETDTTPIGAMGKVTQLTFGALNPGNIGVNLMSANITASAAGSSADLLTDLKSGYLLGANPRKQFLAQFAGIFIGTLVTVLAFRMLVPTADKLGTKEFPAPAAQTWSAVAKALSQGISVLEPIKVQSMIVGGVLGIVFVLLPVGLPRWQKYFPSAAAFGLAWVFEWGTAFLFFLGALIAWMLEKRAPATSKEFTFPVASGLIAGGSLMGVLLIFTENGPAMWASLRQAIGW